MFSLFPSAILFDVEGLMINWYLITLLVGDYVWLYVCDFICAHLENEVNWEQHKHDKSIMKIDCKCCRNDFLKLGWL